jgi:hypothetical protein
MKPLIKYDAACRALAAASSVDEVKDISNRAVALAAYARQAKNRDLEANAVVLRVRAERRLGEMLTIQKKTVGLAKPGRKPAIGSRAEPISAPTLAEAGIDKKLSARAQKIAAMPMRKFEASLTDLRKRIILTDATIINGARSVMASREHPTDDFDFAPTPPWATRALMERVLPNIRDVDFEIREQKVWEPACGEGHMAEVLREYFRFVHATDIHDYGYGDVVDFLGPNGKTAMPMDWIITNPPFEDKAEAFTLRALDLANVGVAIFAQLRWLETIGRYERIFRDRPPTLLALFVERVPICMGRWEPDGGTATAYMWLVWVKDRMPQAPLWIPPGCREALTRPDDVKRFTAHPVICRKHGRRS